MNGRIQQRPAHLLLPRWQELYLAAEPMPREASFHEALLDCAEEPAEDHAEPRPGPQPTQTVATEIEEPAAGVFKRTWTWLKEKNAASAAQRMQIVEAASIEKSLDAQPAMNQQLGRSSSSLLARGWSWFREKSGASSTKRLRVADFTALGEKRFVALVKVEGREFLIGGGASGVSLLTKLDAAEEPAHAIRREYGIREAS